MSRRLGLSLLVLAGLAVVPVARGAGPAPYAQQGGAGVVSRDGSARFVAVSDRVNTVLTKIATTDGQLLRSVALNGSFGIPVLTYGSPGDGLSPDGETLVLGNTGIASPSRFVIVDARTLRVRDELSFDGAFAFDALSPNGSKLYLIQHASTEDVTHYVVRGYDLRAHRLLPGRIADKTQKSWVMQGYPMTRATSADGRWAYTLYQNPQGYPFIHALDTVRGVAHCIGLPWTANDQGPLWNIVLTLREGGKSLAVHWKSGRPWLNVDTASWRITHVAPGSFPWLWLGLGIGAAALAAAAALPASRVRGRADGRGDAPALAHDEPARTQDEHALAHGHVAV